MFKELWEQIPLFMKVLWAVSLVLGLPLVILVILALLKFIQG